jgi:hypothetical protein
LEGSGNGTAHSLEIAPDMGNIRKKPDQFLDSKNFPTRLGESAQLTL